MNKDDLPDFDDLLLVYKNALQENKLELAQAAEGVLEHLIDIRTSLSKLQVAEATVANFHIPRPRQIE